jgi:plasmid stabilization system protein ParE
MTRLVLAPRAEQDLEDIWEYIAQDSVSAANRFIGKIEDNIRRVALNPGIGHSREDLAAGRNLLFWPVGNYLIIYRTLPSAIEVVAVAHGKRDIPALIRRRQM